MKKVTLGHGKSGWRAPVALLTAMVCGVGSLRADEIELWDGLAPGESEGENKEETVKGEDGIARTSLVTEPSLTFFPAPAENSSGAVVLVMPGGGYQILAIEHEGTKVCEWLNEQGISAVLLKYRVPRREGLAKHHAPLQDAQRALGIIHAKAEEWQINPDKVGVLGFSAGGHLAAMALSDPERSFPLVEGIDGESIRPDFGILIYPAYLVDEKDPDALAAELDINERTQPIFMAVASDDKHAASSARLYLELQRLGTSVELHSFAKGGHGFGITKLTDQPAGTWPQRCAEWMSELGLNRVE